jgi:multisubunit Na+/H+ antiporter MnhF subunit
MNPWLAASIALSVGLMACGLACLRSDPPAALAALNVASVVATMLMVTLTEAFARQPFIDLAEAMAALSLVGSLAFVRFLGRRARQ